MPTYDYECKRCDHQFEEFQSITAKPLRKCPACGRMGLRRLIGAGAGIIFKGSGFYATDYKKGSAPGRKTPSSDSSPSSTAASGSSAPPD